jgi:hypothetical protein
VGIGGDDAHAEIVRIFAGKIDNLAMVDGMSAEKERASGR